MPPNFFPSLAEALARRDFFEHPLNPIEFFADYSDRLLIFRRVGQWSDSIQSAPYLMIPSPNEVEPGAPLFAISVNATDEPGGEPGEYQTKQRLDRNPIGCSVKVRKQDSIDRFTHPKRRKQYSSPEQIYF